MADLDDTKSTEEAELLSAEARAKPFVLYRNPAGKQRIVELPEDGHAPVTIGRGSWMDISLPWDEGASRLHARLEPLGDDWTVIDDGTSANGTWLNGEKITGRKRLNDGDELRVGQTNIRICMPGHLDEGATVILDPDDLPPPETRG